MSIDKWLAKVYDKAKYNCLHFTCDVWEDETGEDIRPRFGRMVEDGLNSRKMLMSYRHYFRKLKQPISPSIVTMDGKFVDPHIGIYLRRKILHITPLGVFFVEPFMATRGFDDVRYYQ